MERGLLEHLRAEKLIGAGRLVLAVFTLAVIFIDPDVANIGRWTRIALATLFAIYSVGLAMAPVRVAEYRVAVHVIDFAIFALLIQFTSAAVSPFFIFFLFSVIAALLRFGVRGMLITAGSAMLTYVILALSDRMIPSQPGYLIMRVASLFVATLLLANLGMYQERVRTELRRLAAWPRTLSEQREPLIRDTLTLARDSLLVPRVLLVWDDEEEPWMWAAILDADQMSITREPPDFLEWMIVPEVGEATFIIAEDGTVRTVAHHAGRLTIQRRDAAIAPDAVQRFAIGSTLSAPVLGQTVAGRLFFLGRELEAHDAAVAEITARLVATRLDELNAAKRSRAAAVGEERLRVARDLHDGLLQSLTGAALQLEMVHHLVATDPAAARDRLRNVQDLIAADQRELRSLISQLRPKNTASRPSLQTRLHELADRFQRQWDLAVTITVADDLAGLREGIASDVSSIVTEAMSNAAKHARAGRIDASVTRSGSSITIVVSDDGSGFPFFGSYSLAELDAERRGPVTLKERVASLGGHLHLTSTPTGSRIEVTIDVSDDLVL